MHTVIETSAYLSDAKAVGLTEAEREAVVEVIANDPRAGDEIKGTDGARKVRLAGRGKGKSGGYRVITFYSGMDVPVFLLSVYLKGEKSNLSKSEKKELKQELKGLVEDYKRAGGRYV